MNLTPASILLVASPLAVQAQQTTPAWHPQYDLGWEQGRCLFEIDENSPSFPTQLACCKGAYAGQTSGYCLSQLPSPPTTSPTNEGNLLDVFYPDYSSSWTDAGCRNDGPLPVGRPTYPSRLACCKGAYAGQMSGKCLSELESPPTTSPTNEGGADFFYPDYETAYASAGCKNDLPLPFLPGGRPTYSSMLACCKGAYAGQMSGACLAGLESPPTSSPTNEGGLDVWYPDYSSGDYANGECINERPLPSGRVTYSTMLACCKAAYGSQSSGKCLSNLESPPTTSPTNEGGADFFYPDYDTPWASAVCKNDLPLPFLPGGRPTYSSMLACCKGAYAGQSSGACLAGLESPPTSSPTNEGGLDVWYPNYAGDYSNGECINERPLPLGRPNYPTMLACCKAAYGSQSSGKCIAGLESPPTLSPTNAGGLDVWYPNYAGDYANGMCINDYPLPSGRPNYPTQLACCKAAYGSQVSGYCLSNLESPPTTSPTTEVLEGYYADRSGDYSTHVCSNERPAPPSEQLYDTKMQCCASNYGSQSSKACYCDANPCHSCDCPGAASNSNCVGSLSC